MVERASPYELPKADFIDQPVADLLVDVIGRRIAHVRVERHPRVTTQEFSRDQGRRARLRSATT